ncbi:tandem-95 repeat protein [Tahibacter amnicola]|uniref:Ig-like domain-containing protein n=1 Tax=Tahibacter amnicola TaxID=2976241 RepID=A0ABY6BGX6_9GAMM|nr:Ig-like domain-containing protein [Tahibacter amnicola]UXI69274.1 Ig-like domain-containing protein [Tahibacter amnicola]
MTGADFRLQAEVTGGATPQVIAVRRAACSGGAFGADTPIGGGYPVGLNNGLGGADVVELTDALANISSGWQPNALRLAVVANSATGQDDLLTTPSGGPILLGLPALPIPFLTWPILLVLAGIVAFLGARRAKRTAAWRVLSLFLIATGVAIAANFAADGDVSDWANAAPLATDPTGDATTTESAIDIVAVFGALENQRAFFRVDVRDLQNNPPTVTPATATTLEDQAVTVTLTGTDPEGANITFAIATGPANGTLGAITPTGPTSATVSYTPNANYNGTDSFTFTGNDGQGSSVPATATITITPVNDAPLFTRGADQSVTENAGAQTVAGWATGISGGPTADETSQTVTFTATVTNTTGNLTFAVAPAVASNGTLTYTPTNGTSGIATISVVATDNGGTANGGVDTSAAQTFTIAVNAINHAPTFTAGGAQTSLEDAGPQTVANWATAISDGDGNTQALTFNVTNNTNPALFSTAPAVSPTGTLTYTAAPDANGSATITLVLQDNGGTAGGGVDTSAPQTVTITVTPVNDAPSFTVQASTSAFENAGPQTVPGFATSIVPGPTDETTQTVTFAATVGATTGTLAFSAAPAIAPNGTLTYTAQNGTIGTATVNVTLQDNGGTANGGVDTSAAQSFTITISNVNDAPSFVVGANQTSLEDAGPQTVAAWATSITDNDANTQTLTFNVTGNTNPTLFSAGPSVAADGTLTYTAAANANGTATITLTLQDNGGTANGGVDTSAPQSFTITVTAVNDVPSFDLGTSASVLESAGPQTFAAFATNILAGPADESGQTLAFTATVGATTGNLAFSAAPAIAPNGTLTFTAQNGTSGTATVSVTLQDNGGTANGGVDTTAAQTFTITVNNVNDAPSFVVGANQTSLEDAGPQTVAAWATSITDNDANTQTLTFNVTGNTNPTLFSAGPSVAADGTLTYTAAANANGTATITLTLQDNGGTANGGVDTSAPQSFTITVTPVNDVPSFDLSASASALENAGPSTFAAFATNILAGPVDENGQTLAFTATVGATTGNLAFSAAPAIAANGTLTFTAQNGTYGTATVSVTLQDNGGTTNGGVDTSAAQTFTITVSNVNDAPSFTVGPNQTILEDAGAQTVNPWATGISDNDGGLQTLTFNVTGNTNPSLFAAGPSVAADGTLTYTPATNANGTATITLTLSDNGGTANGGSDTSAPQSFTITVTAVNDAPSFTAGTNPTVNEDSGLTTLTNWATAISPGPADESSQTVSFTANVTSGAALFTIPPAISPTGTLTFTVAPDANGTASVDVTLQDNGGTANSGVDTSAAQTVTITITAADDAPVAVNDAATVVEDAGATSVNVLANDTDIDGGPISVTSVTQPANGTVVITGGGTGLTYQPNPNYCNNPPGTTLDTFTYTLTPGASTATVTMTVTCADDAPVAVADSATVAEDDPATAVPVLANDTDVDGGPISITSVTQPANGTVVITGGGTGLTYQPNPDYCNNPPGTVLDTFTYTLTPGGSSTTVTMTVNCVNDAPVNTVPGAQVIGAGATRVFNAANSNVVSTADIDAGGGTISATVSVPTAADGSIALANTGGLVSITGQGTNNVVATGTLAAINAAFDGMAYTAPVAVPTPNPVTLTIVVDDQGNTGTGSALSDTDTISIAIDNAPTVTLTTPANGSTTANNVALSVTFSESVNASAGAVTLTCGGGNLITGGDSGTGVMSLTPTYAGSLPSGATCTLTVLAANVVDADAIDPPDNMAANFVVSFTTDAAPTVTSTTPTNGATAVTSDATITLNFSEPVDLTASAFTLNCGSAVTVTGLPATNVSSVVLTPSTALPGGATCTGTVVAAQVSDNDSFDPPQNMAANFVFSFQTDAAPTVTVFTPANASTVASTATLSITFSENVDLTAGAVTLLCNAVPVAFTAVPALPATGTGSLVVTPTGGLPAGGNCTATVVATEVSDSDTADPPNLMAANEVRTFSVDAAPTVTSTVPANGATDVLPNSTIVVNFDESVAFSTLANAANTSFDLECPAATPADFILTTASPATSVTIDPTDAAVAGQTCTLTVRATGITDADAIDPPDNMAADYTATIAFGSLAADDSYNVTPHLTLQTALGAAEVDANDIMGAGTITGFGFGSCTGTTPGNLLDAGAANGRLTLNADGTFSYEPPANVANATRTFCYTVTGGDTANIAFNIQNTEFVWFVDAGAAAAGTGTQARPFQTVGAAVATDSASDTIYVAFNAAGYTTGITLETSERLIGAGASGTLATHSGITPVTGSAFPALAGTAPTLTCSGVTCVALATGNMIRGVVIGDSGAAGTDIGGTSFGTLTFSELTLNGTGRALNLVTGTLAGTFVDLDASSGNNEGVLLDAVNGTWGVAGTVDIGNVSGTAVSIQNQPAAGAMTFTGGITINKTSAGTGLLLNANLGTAAFNALNVTTGAGTAVSVTNAPLSATSGTVAATGGPAILSNTANFGTTTFTSVSSTNSTGSGISLTGSSGSLTMNGGAISGNAANQSAFLVSGSAGGGISYAGTVAKTTAGRLVDIAGAAGGNVTLSGNLTCTSCGSGASGIRVDSRTGGTILFSGASKAITSSAAGVVLSSNGGATINFTGGNLDIVTTTGAGFSATGGGSISVQGAGNSITSTTGTALTVTSTTISGSGMTFEAISANGAANGIALTTTGGSLTVTGTGGVNSGGIIQNTTAEGVVVNASNNLSLTRMRLFNTGSHGISIANSNGLTMANVDVVDAGDADEEHGLNLSQVGGTVAITGGSFDGAAEDLVRLVNNNLNMTLNVTGNVQFSFPAVIGASAGNAFNVQPNGTSAFTANINGNTFTNIRATSLTWGAAALSSNGTSTLDFVNNTINVTLAARAAGILISGQESTTTDIFIDNNDFTGAGGNGVIATDVNDVSTVTGTITNNTVTNPPGHGFFHAVDEDALSRIEVMNNLVSNSGGEGIQTVNFGGVGVSDFDMAILDNNVATHNTNTAVAFVGGVSYTGFEDNSCVIKRGNTVSGTPASPTQCGGAPCDAYHIEEVGGITRMEEIPNTGATTASSAYVGSINTGTPVTVFGIVDLTNGAACPRP